MNMEKLESIKNGVYKAMTGQEKQSIETDHRYLSLEDFENTPDNKRMVVIGCSGYVLN